MHAAESLHWYDRKGNPAYQVKARDGSMRNTTLRDARKLGLVPSVTTIIRCAAAPGLERWKLDQMLHAALTLPRGSEEPEAEWISRVWMDSKETARKAAERGTAVHASLQAFYQGEPWGQHQSEVIGANNAISEWIGIQKWKAERSFANPLGYGGKVDLSCDAGVLDFKTKEFDEGNDLKAWPEHAMQLAAYRVGLGIPGARCAIVYVSVTNPGLARLIEIKEADLAKGWRMFQGLLEYWKAKTGFDPAWSEGDVPERIPAEAEAQ